MAFDHDGLFTVLGKYVKTINSFDSLITTLDSDKSAIFTVLAAENLGDQYVTIPSKFNSYKSSAASWISTMIGGTTAILTDKTYVLDQLPLYAYDVNSVLQAIYNYMVDNSETVKSSIVKIATVDKDNGVRTSTEGVGYAEESNGVHANSSHYPLLFVTRTLDGVNSPGNSAPADSDYDGVESQLAITSTITAEVTGVTAGSETCRLYGSSAPVGPYGINPESPGSGPTLNSIEVGNLVGTNHDFTSWSTDTPTGWLFDGTITTDYYDISTTGAGPLGLKTEGTTAYKKLTGLSHNRMYLAAIDWGFVSAADVGDNILGVRLRNLAGTDIVAQVTKASNYDNFERYNVLYKFFSLPTSVDLNDVYLEIEYVTEDTTSDILKINDAIVAPVTYFNGMGWAFYVPDSTNNALRTKITTAISNGNEGVFQTFFRKAYKMQLPSADSPTILESFAT